VSKSQNVKDGSHWNKYLRKIKINLWTKVEICISTYSNADVVLQRHLAEWKERISVKLLTKTLKINLKIIHFKLVVGHTIKQAPSCDISNLGFNMSGSALTTVSRLSEMRGYRFFNIRIR